MSLIVCRLRPPLYRKVEDLQFRVEEESITKGDLEVFIVFIDESDTCMSPERQKYVWTVGQKKKLCSSFSTTFLKRVLLRGMRIRS